MNNESNTYVMVDTHENQLVLIQKHPPFVQEITLSDFYDENSSVHGSNEVENADFLAERAFQLAGLDPALRKVVQNLITGLASDGSSVSACLTVKTSQSMANVLARGTRSDQ